jgi:hypothetical protein
MGDMASILVDRQARKASDRHGAVVKIGSMDTPSKSGGARAKGACYGLD